MNSQQSKTTSPKMLRFPRSVLHQLLIFVLLYGIIVAQPIMEIQHVTPLSVKHTRWSSYPSIRNFDKFTNLFALHNCLSVIDLEGVDLESNFPPPSIIRRIVKYALHIPEDKRIYRARGPANLYQFYPQNLTSLRNDSSSFPCPLSKYLDNYRLQYPRERVLCLRLNCTRFWMQAKSQNCKIHFILFPTETYKNVEAEVVASKFVFPNVPPPSIKVVIHEHVSTYKEEIKLIRLIRLELLERCDQVILLLSVKMVTPQLSGDLMLSEFEITNVNLWRLCPEQWGKAKYAPLPIQTNVLRDLQKLVDLTLPSPESHLIWMVGKTASSDTVVGQVERIIGYCVPSFTKLPLKTPVELVGRGYALSWLSILKNYSIISSSEPMGNMYYGTSCTKGMKEWIYFEERDIVPDVEFQFTPHIRTQTIFPNFPRDDQSGLRFVSCGRRGLSTIPFHELISVYDKWVWVTILVAMVTLIAYMKFLSTPSVSIILGWMATLKILLEHGDKVFDNKRFKLATGMFLLMGIVISNAYKNTNVYNMIAPRKPIPYEFAKELLSDNFTLLTRLESIEAPSSTYLKRGLMKQLEISGGSYIQFDFGEEESLVGISEVASHMRNFILTFDKRLFDVPEIASRVREATATTSLGSSGVLTRSRMAPGVAEQFRNFSFPKYWGFYDDETRAVTLRELINGLRKEETNIMFNLLRACRHAALILPQHLCYNYSRKIKKDDHRTDVFVGKEVYSDIQWMFSFKRQGKLSRQVISRIKILHESGHWQKWTKLYYSDAKQYNDYNEKENVVAAGLDGNVVLIFDLFIVGLGVALGLFLFETSPFRLFYLATHPHFDKFHARVEKL